MSGVYAGIAGFVIGWLLGGPVLAFLCGMAGAIFARGIQTVKLQDNPAMREEVERAFFSTVFPLLGRLAKSDGRISEEEITGTEELMRRMGLGDDDRKRAIELFKEGAKPDYDVDQAINTFLTHCGQFNNLKQIFLVYMITIAYADGTLHPEEETLLSRVAGKLGYSKFAFNHLLGMIQAQTYFYKGQQDSAGYRRSGANYENRANQNELELAYRALGVEASIDDKELKKAYRKLMSEYHPDKLQGRGVPEDMVKLATERSQEIQAAYDLIKKHRK